MQPTPIEHLPFHGRDGVALKSKPLVISAAVLTTYEEHGPSAQPGVSVIHDYGTSFRFSSEQARAFAAALTKHADYLDLVLSAVAAFEAPTDSKPRRGYVGDVVAFADIPMGASFWATASDHRGRRSCVGDSWTRVPGGSRRVGSITIKPAHLHAEVEIYEITSLAEPTGNADDGGC